jgi:hypothetical protein
MRASFFLFSSNSKTLKFWILSLIIFCGGFGKSLSGQTTIPICEVYKKFGGLPKGYNGPIITDRFSNEYTLNEIQNLPEQLNTCSFSSIFDLHFITSGGAFTAAEQYTICLVFKQVSDLIAPSGSTFGTIRINIAKFIPQQNDPAGFASGYYGYECGLANSNILEILKTGVNPLGANVPAGYLFINPGIPWHTTEGEISPINNPPLSTPGMFDLHSVVLHEIGHLLGIASRIGKNGNGINGNYASWDRYLSVNGKHLILPVTGATGCCDKHEFNSTDFPIMPDAIDFGCEADIVFDHPNILPSPEVNRVHPILGNQPVQDDNEMRNKLSHLDGVCSGGMLYVMNGFIDEGVVRRTFLQDEEKILCVLGYSGTASCNSNNSCQPITNNDNATIIVPFVIGFGLQPPYEIDVTLNDWVPNSFVIGIEMNCSSFPPDMIQQIPNGFKVIDPDLHIGNWTVCYSITTVCNGITYCDQAKLNIKILESISSDCEGCDLVCMGDFEQFPFTTSVNFNQLGLNKFKFIQTQQNTPDIFGQSNSNFGTIFNKILGLYTGSDYGSGLQNIEGFILPLKEPILPGCTAKISYTAASDYDILLHPTMPHTYINFVGLNEYGVCTSPGPIELIKYPICPTFEQCTGQSDAYCIGSSAVERDFDLFGYSDNPAYVYVNLDLVNGTIDWINPPNGQPINYLIIFGTFDGFDPYASTIPPGVRFFIDNVSVKTDCQNKITITPSVVKKCAGDPGEVQISYEVCLEPGLNNTDLNVDVNLIPSLPPPIGVTVIPGSCFNNSGIGKVHLSSQNLCETCTLTVNIPVNYSVGDVLSIGMTVDVSPDFCADVPSGVMSIDVVLDDCGPVDPPEQACICSIAGNDITIGYNSLSVNELHSLTNIPQVITNKCISITGILKIDQDWSLTNCRLILQSGAQIVVTNGSKFEVYNGTTFEGCTTLWQGITVESGSTFISEGGFSENKIADAIHAIKPKSGAKIRLLSTNFDKDYIGIYTEPTANGSSQSITTMGLSFNTFTCSSQLLPHYSNSGPALGNISYATAVLNNTVGIDFGKNNTVDGISNGLIAYKSSFSITRCTLKNLRNNPIPAFSNRGVYAENCLLAKVIQSRFEKIHESIYSFQSNIQADGNNIENLSGAGSDFDIGIRVENGNNKQTRIRDNTIWIQGNGVWVSNCLNPSLLRIRGNYIYYKNYAPTPSISSASCILLESCGRLFMYNNYVYNKFPHFAGRGISLINCYSRNLIQKNYTYDFEINIDVQGGYGNEFNSNYALTTTGTNPTGFNIANSGNNLFCQNVSVNQTLEGFFFSGECGHTNFKCNNIGTANYGLYLDGGSFYTEIGLQENRGNTWTGNYSTLGAYNAYDASTNLNDVTPLSLSRFLMKPSAIPSWNTGSGQILWFSSFLGTELSCTDACPLSIDNDPVPPTVIGEGNDSEITDSDIRTANSGHFGIGINWMSQERLYARLKAYQNLLLSEEDISNFYLSASSSSIGQFYNLHQKTNLLLSRSEVEQSILNEIQNSAIIFCDSLNKIREFGDSTSHYQTNKMEVIQAQISQKINQLSGYFAWIDEQRVNTASNLFVENSGIVANNTCSANEKTLNALDFQNDYFLTNLHPDSSALIVLKNIADQCPITGGLAVYKARCYYHRYHPESFWDDRSNCSGNDLGSRLFLSKAEDITYEVWPNPADQKVYVHSSIPLAQGGKIEIYSVTGKVIAFSKIPANSNTSVINVNDLPTGIYFYRICNQNAIVKKGKLIISH